MGQSIPRTVTGASGKNVSNASAGLFYNVGEISVTTLSASSHFLTQGFVQPPDATVSTIGTTVDNASSINVFPNPSSETIFITSEYELNFASFELYDIQGRKIQDSQHVVKITSSKYSINISSLAKGAYFLKINNINTHKPLSFFRLLKM